MTAARRELTPANGRGRGAAVEDGPALSSRTRLPAPDVGQPNANGAHYSPDREGARVKELMAAVGLKGVSLHSLRHTFAPGQLSDGRTARGRQRTP